ncbi:MAG TPA: glycosyltransferase family 4 protein [Anaerolineae bacterium]|nr:glycosyltransferase family 4 protein [Anaerolineae bacterium]
MRILIATDIFPPDIGGPATYVPIIAAELAQRGHAVRVLTYSQTDQVDTHYPFKVERILLRGSRVARLLRTFRRIASNVHWAEVVYLNGLLIETSIVNFILRKPAAAKVVGDITWERARDKGWIDAEFEDFQNKKYGWRIELRRGLRNWALRRARIIIVPSAYLKRIVSHWPINLDRVQIVYNSFEPKMPAAASIDLPLKTHYRIITSCRLTAWKGVDGLIEAIAALPDTGLVIVGDGPERSRLIDLARRLKVTDRVYFVGQVPADQVAGYLRACNLFVLNSRYEGLPHGILEALATGLPVIAADAGGTSEIVQDRVNGRLVPVLDQAALQAAIRDVLDRPELRQAWISASQKTLERFSRQVMIEHTVEILEAALS